MGREAKSLNLLSEETVKNLRNAFEQMMEANESVYEFPLVVPPFGFEEILESIDTLLSNHVTMGKKVAEFERLFAEYLGVRNAVMVNSGSSANLIAMSILSNPSIEDCLHPGDKVVVPALTWSTSVFPILDVGLTPVFADSELKTLNLDINSVRNCITPEVKAIMAVHLIGNPCNLTELREIAEEHSIFLIEDCCEAHGTEFQRKKVGTAGDIGTYSFFFSHHISTIEGGMVVTDNDEYAELARILRAHGWTRDMKNRGSIEKQYSERDPQFLFVNRGYNLRPTEIQGAFGIHQIRKLDRFVKRRRRIASILIDELRRADIPVDLQVEQVGGKHSWFGFPMVLRDCGWEKRKKTIEQLDKRSIETRVVMGGDMSHQPAMDMFRCDAPVPLDVARHVDRSGIMVGLNVDMSDEKVVELAHRIEVSIDRS